MRMFSWYWFVDPADVATGNYEVTKEAGRYLFDLRGILVLIYGGEKYT